jgi:hypothetical protein
MVERAGSGCDLSRPEVPRLVGNRDELLSGTAPSGFVA